MVTFILYLITVYFFKHLINTRITRSLISFAAYKHVQVYRQNSDYTKAFFFEKFLQFVLNI